MFRISKYLIITVLLTGQIACSPVEDSYRAELTALSISSGVVDNAQNPLISAQVNGGNFVISWESQFSSPSGIQIFEAYFSADGIPEEDKNEKFVSVNCGSASTICNTTGSLNCSVDANGLVSCGGIGGQNFSTLIGASGVIAQFIARVCIYDQNNIKVCDLASIPIHLAP